MDSLRFSDMMILKKNTLKNGKSFRVLYNDSNYYFSYEISDSEFDKLLAKTEHITYDKFRIEKQKESHNKNIEDEIKNIKLSAIESLLNLAVSEDSEEKDNLIQCLSKIKELKSKIN